MKKFFSITIILAILIFSTCIPAFAEEYNVGSYTPPNNYSDTDSQVKCDIIYTERPFVDFPNETIELTNEEKLKIANDYIAQYGGMWRDSDREPDQYTVRCFKTLSNGMKLVNVRDNTGDYNCLCYIMPLGKYVYLYGGGTRVNLYQNGVFTEFDDAYESGMINDAILDEINEVMYFDRYAEPTTQSEPQPDPGKITQPIQAATQAAAQAVVTTAAEADTTVQTTTVPTTTEATLDRATPVSTPDLASAGSNSGGSGTASKGDNPAPAIFIALAVATVAGIGIAAAKKSV